MHATTQLPRRLGALAWVATVLVAPAAASAERLPPRLIQRSPVTEVGADVVAPELVTDGGDAPEATARSSNLIFLNRCAGGCTVTPGASNSMANRSEVALTTGTLSEFAHSDALWDEVVECVKFVYAPYDVRVTEEDPGATPHFEIMIAGRYDEIGQEPAGGYGVGACGSVLDNSISFAFANNEGAGDAAWLCYVVAQETAHNFGLDHVLEPMDPMTYMPYDGVRYFQDDDAACGESSARDCCAGPATQNSHAYLMSEFGPGDDRGPRVNVVRPADGAQVEPGFAIEAEVGRYADTVVVSLDGVAIASSDEGPFVWNAPAELADGVYQLEIAATDLRGTTNRRTISVRIGEPPDGMMGMGGCAAGGAGSGGAGAALALLGVALATRRRR